ncbi:MAG TPA: response regulator [Methanotrichaceae archaeon]|nr:response regulator [Methanotrichaceae archaeon]
MANTLLDTLEELQACLKHNQELEEANETLRLINELSLCFLQQGDLQECLKDILITAKRLVSANIASIAVYKNPGILKAWAYNLGSAECEVQSLTGSEDKFPGLAIKYSPGVVIDNEMVGTVSPPECITLKNALSLGVEVKDGYAHLILGNKDDDFNGEDAEKLETLGKRASMIIDRAKLDEALKQSEDALRRQAALIDLCPNSILVRQLDGTITFWSQGAQSLYGWTRQEAIGQQVHTLLITQFPQPLEQIIEHVWQTGRWSGELIHCTKDGKQVFVHSQWQAKFDDQGDLSEILESNVDITERKLTEKELCRVRDELEQRVQERTAELSQAKEDFEITNEELQVINEELRMELMQHELLEKELIRAKDIAEDAANIKAQFMANMSHEIRTPMNTIIGMTSLLLEENLSAEQRDFVEMIRSGGESLMALINDIMDLSKIEHEKTELELQDFDLRQRVEEALDLIAQKASEKDLDLAYTFEKGVPEAIVGDPARLRQVLVNLLGNAVKFTNQGEIVLTVSPEECGKIRFSVRDTGIGIPKDKIGLLFQPFSQVDASITRSQGGAGLGLAISKKQVELMGGEIWAESQAGAGSTFHFTIMAEAAPAKTKSFLEEQPQLADRSVLIIEDKRATRRILGRQILSWDMVPVIASSAEKVLKWLNNENTFDAIILDANIPGVDEIVDEIHERGLPMVAIVSIGQRVSDKFVTSLTKPIKPSQLYIALSTIFVQKAGESQRAPACEKAEADYGPLHILLADDNVSNQKVTLHMLRKLGYRADAVSNGLEAIEALKRQHYDVVLMDIKMPILNGIEATREIRRLWPDDGPKIIALTAYALDSDRDKCLAAGMDGYLRKPIQLSELADALSE